MNRTTSCIITITASLMLFLSGGKVLAQTEEQIEQFLKEREAYFNKNLELTDAEAKAFWPLYNDFSYRKMKIQEDERNTFYYARKNAENMSDEEIGETLDKIRRLRTDLHNLEQEYYHIKFKQVLPPGKVLKLYQVEFDFRRHLLRQIRGGGEGGPGRRNQGGPGGGGSGGISQEGIPDPSGSWHHQ